MENKIFSDKEHTIKISNFIDTILIRDKYFDYNGKYHVIKAPISYFQYFLELSILERNGLI